MSYMHREYRPDGTFWVSEWRDDDTRTVTTYDETGAITSTRLYTADENTAADAAQAEARRATVSTKLTDDTAADLEKLNQAITKQATLLGAAAVPGSIRAIMGNADTPGTTSLRALKAQGNTAVVTAQSIKALIGLVIDLAQLQIDGTQASRTVARQVLREAKLLVGDLDSADVGAEVS